MEDLSARYSTAWNSKGIGAGAKSACVPVFVEGVLGAPWLSAPAEQARLHVIHRPFGLLAPAMISYSVGLWTARIPCRGRGRSIPAGREPNRSSPAAGRAPAAWLHRHLRGAPGALEFRYRDRLGVRAGRAAMVRQVSHPRGIDVSAEFPTGSTAVAAASDETLLAAAFSCADEADFLAAISRQRDGASG